MITIRPISDLRNKFSEVEDQIRTTQKPVFLTKNGYGTMVLLSIEQYSQLTDDASLDSFLDETDRLAATDPTRLTHEEVFSSVRAAIDKNV